MVVVSELILHSRSAKERLTDPGSLLETEVEVRVPLQAGDEDTVESDGGGHGDAGPETATEAGVPLSQPAAQLHFGEHSSYHLCT